MLKKTITYEDFNGVERTEDFYFNFTKAEALDMELGINGGMSALLNRLIATRDQATIISIWKDMLLKSYGEKSDDGKRFIKSPELSKAFSETGAYSILYMELATDDVAAANFVNSVFPKAPNVEQIPANTDNMKPEL